METEIRTRERRLVDIARGKRYFRRIDDLASQQWGINAPRIPVTRSQFVTLHPSIKPHHVHTASDEPNITPNIKERISSERPFLKQRKNKDFTKSRCPRVQSEKMSSSTNKGIYHGNLNSRLFNQWGSGVNPLDEKITLTKEDLEPKFEPYHFRDETKRIHKTVPKKGVPMSRVVHDGKDRQLKTITGFHSSRNGLVNVIHPVGPTPELDKQNTYVDQASLQREKTANLLKRIERLIHPNKHVLKCYLEPSEEEIQSSKSPTLSNYSYDLQRNAYLNQRNESTSDVEKINPPIYAKQLIGGSSSQTKTKMGRIKSTNKSVALTIEELNKNEMDVNRKCRLWIDSWMDE